MLLIYFRLSCCYRRWYLDEDHEFFQVLLEEVGRDHGPGGE